MFKCMTIARHILQKKQSVTWDKYITDQTNVRFRQQRYAEYPVSRLLDHTPLVLHYSNEEPIYQNCINKSSCRLLHE